MHLFSFSRFCAFLAVPTLFFLSGCGVSDPNSPKFVVAEGKGVKVTRAELERTEADFLKQSGMSVNQIPPEQMAMLDRRVLQQLVIEALLLNQSSSMKLSDLNSKVEKEIEKIKAQSGGEESFKEQLQKKGLTLDGLKADILKNMQMQEVLTARVPPGSDPSAAAIEKFYTDNKAHFVRPAGVRASHVLVLVPRDATPEVKAQKKKIIDAARARVAKGEDFSKVAKEVSEDPVSAAQGGDVGFFGKGQMVPEFEKVAFSTKVGAVSPVFATPYGYHFLRVTENKPAGTVPLEEAKPTIANYLKNQDNTQKVTEYLKKLEADAKVVYHLPQTREASNTPAQAAPAPGKADPK